MPKTSWEIVTEVLLQVSKKALPGVPLTELDKLAEDIILSHDAIPYNKGYKGDKTWYKEVKPVTPFPNTLVVNVNSTIAHGTPTAYIIREGDSIIFDVGVKKDGLCGDGALTVPIGKIESKHERLIRYARLSCLKGIEVIKPGVSLAEFGRTVERYISRSGYVVNQTFASHAIGVEMHEDPVIPNYWRLEYEEKFFEEGKMYCIEPLISFKDMWGMRAFNDWAWLTRDGRRGAMFEHQILVTSKGAKILTKHF